MASNLTTRLNSVKSLKIYWLFLYSYTDNVKRELPIDKILLFPVRVYTKSKSGSLPTIMVEKPLNLDSDNDLDMLIKKFGLNYVRSVSEMVISENTNLIAIQIDSSKKLKGYHIVPKLSHPIGRLTSDTMEPALDAKVKPPSGGLTSGTPRYHSTNRLFFYSVDKSPEHYVNDDGLKNTSLSEKIKVSIGIKNVVSTNVTLGRIFSFIFKDHFEAVIVNKTIVDKESIINKDIEEVDEDGYDTDATTDSQMSLYSYNRKYNIKDI